jgi:SAM-dependent methyltransferase
MSGRGPQPPFPSEDHEAMVSLLGIGPRDRVLDVGGGHRPFSRADVVTDLDFSGGRHRDGMAVPENKEGRRWICAAAEKLPFADNSFDFVYCAHVLEHVPDPAAACEEMMRVGRRGFIETPRKETEHYAGHPSHIWLVDDPEGKLVFSPIPYRTSPFLNFFLPPMWQTPPVMESVLGDYHHISCVQFLWTGRFEYRVERDNASPVVDDTLFAERHHDFAKNLLFWAAPPETGLFHAKEAARLFPENRTYRRLYAAYRAMTGDRRGALREGISFTELLGIMFDHFICRLHRWTIRRHRKLMNAYFLQDIQEKTASRVARNNG